MATDTETGTTAPATRAGSVSWRRRLLYILAGIAVVAVAIRRFGGVHVGISAAALAGTAVLVLIILRLPHLRKHFHNPYKKGPGSLNYPGQRGLGLARPARKGPGKGPGLPRLMRPRRSGSAVSPPRRRGGAGLLSRSRRSSRPGGASPVRAGSRRGGILRGRRPAGTTSRARRRRSPGTGRGGAGSALAGRRAARRTSAGRPRSGRAGSRIFPGRRTGTGTGTRRRAGTGTNGRRPGSGSRGRMPSRWHPVARRRAVAARRAGTGRGTGRRPGTGRSTGTPPRLPSRWRPLARRRAVAAGRRAGTGRGTGRRPGTGPGSRGRLPSRWYPLARRRAVTAGRKQGTAPQQPSRRAARRAHRAAIRAARPGLSWVRSGWYRMFGVPQQPGRARRGWHRLAGTPVQRAARRLARRAHRSRVRARRNRLATAPYARRTHGWAFWRGWTRQARIRAAGIGRRLTRRERLSRWWRFQRSRVPGLAAVRSRRARQPRPLLGGAILGSPGLQRFRSSWLGRRVARLDRNRRDRWLQRRRGHAPAAVRRPSAPVPAVPGFGVRPASTSTNGTSTGRGKPVANVREAADEIQGMIQNWIDANDLDQTLEDLHEIPRAIQAAFSNYAEQLRESTNLKEGIPEAIAQAGAQMNGIADGLQETIQYGVQRS